MSVELFVTGIVAGIALVYFIMHYLSFTAEPIEMEMEISEQSEEANEMYAMSIEEMDAWYNSVMEIFSVKE